MRERKNQRCAGQVPFRLWAPGRLHAFLTFAAASAVAFAPSAVHADATPVVTMGAAADVAEGDALRFPVTLSEPSATPITIVVTTVDGTASAGADYTPQAATSVTFDAGETEKFVQVDTAPDSEAESTAETVELLIVDDGDADPGTPNAIGKIVDPVLTVEPVGAIDEGDAATRVQEFDVKLNIGFRNTFGLKYGAYTGTGFAGTDFQGVTDEDVSFAPGETEKRISVTIIGDEEYRGPNKTFKITLNQFSGGYNPAEVERTFTIVDDEGLPAIDSVTSEVVAESYDGHVQYITFWVTLSHASQDYVTLNVTGDEESAIQVGGSPGNADFEVPAQMIVAPGQLKGQFDVKVYGDDIYEKDETAGIVVTPQDVEEPSATGPAKQGTLTITNDDQPTVTFQDFTYAEGERGINVAFAVSGSTQDPVPWTATVGGLVDEHTVAASDSDFTLNSATTSGVWGPGESVIFLGYLDLENDTIDEFDEKIKVTLELEGVGTFTGLGAIEDDAADLPPRIVLPAGISAGERARIQVPLELDFAGVPGNAATSTEKTVAVDYAVTAGSATAGDDFQASSGTVHFDPPETLQLIDVPTWPDLAVEGNETFDVAVSNPENADVDTNPVAVTIEDYNPVIRVDPPAEVAEGQALRFPLVLAPGHRDPVTVRVSTVGGTATADTDYVPLTDAPVTFQSGQDTAFIDVVTKADADVEVTPETVELRIVDVGGVQAGQLDATGKIVDPSFTVAPVGAITEGGSGNTRNQGFEIGLNVAFDAEVRVDYEVLGETATTGQDFDPVSGTLVFNPGQTAQVIEVPIRGDEEAEGQGETLKIRLSNLRGPTVSGLSDYPFAIEDDDAAPAALTIDSVTASEEPIHEGDARRTVFHTVTMSRPVDQELTLQVEGIDGTAVQGGVGIGSSDYTVPDTVTIPQGQSTAHFDVHINGDEVYEGDETAEIVVRPGPGDLTVSGGERRIPLTIRDNDQAPQVTFDGFAQPEGASGVGVSFTVTGDSQKPYNWSVTVEGTGDLDGAPAEAADFDAAGLIRSGVLAPGDDKINAGTINLLTDDRDEYDEDLKAEIAIDELGTVRGYPSIQDGAANLPPRLVPAPQTSVVEGTDARIPVTLDFASVPGNTATVTEKSIGVEVQTVSGSAIAGDDFATVNDRVDLWPGEPMEIVVPTVADVAAEGPETFSVNLSNVQEAEFSGPQPTVTITEAPVDVTASVGPAPTVNEGRPLRFPVTLDRPSGSPVTVKVSTSSDTATPNEDYSPLTSWDVTFNPGETTKTVEVWTRHDGVDEAGSELITLEIVDFGVAKPGTRSAVGKVVDGVVTITPVDPIIEGNEGIRDQVFEVRLSAPQENPVQINYEIVPGAAAAGEDFDWVTPGTLQWEPGETVKKIVVPIRGDTVNEATDQTFRIRLSQFIGMTVSSGGEYSFTIVEDDGPPSIISVSQVTQAENNPTAIFTVELSHASQNPLNLAVSAVDGTAVVGGDGPGSRDFYLPDNYVHIPPGQTSGTFRAFFDQDTVFEKDESARVVVSPPTDGTPFTGGPKEGTLTITNDDPAPTMSLNGFWPSEGSRDLGVWASVNGEFQDPIPWTATIKGGTDGAGDPAEDADFTRDRLNLSGTVDPRMGRMIDLGRMDVLEDHIDEEEEQIEVTVDSPILGHAVGHGRIMDTQTEWAPRITAAFQQSVLEGDTALLPVRLDFQPGSGNTATSTEREISVDYSTRPVIASQDDFTPVTGTLTFKPGVNEAQISIPTLTDEFSEGNEHFEVTFSNPRNAELASWSVNMTISETPLAPPTVNIKPPAPVAEGGILRFPVTLDRPGTVPISVRVSTVAGTAAEWDYTALSYVEVPFNPGETYKIVEVRTAPDGETEPNRETVHLEVVDLGGAAPGTIRATGEVFDSIISVTPVGDITEGVSGIRDQVFEVRLNHPPENQVRLDYSIEAGTATIAQDFDRPPPGQLVFEPGETVKRIFVPIRGDEIDEGQAETFKINLSNLVGMTASGLGEHTFTIIEDDGTPSVVSVSGAPHPEDGGTSAATFTVKLSNPSSGPVDLPIAATDGTAVRWATGIGGRDYSVPNSVHFEPGQVTATFDAQVYGDAIFEKDETAVIAVVPPADGSAPVTGPPQQATLTIVNDDAAPKVTFDGFEQSEGSGGIGVWFTVTGLAQNPIPWTARVEGGSDGGSDPAETTDFSQEGLRLSGVLQPGATRIDAGTLNLILDNADEHEETIKATVDSVELGTTSGFAKIWDWPSQMPPKVVPIDQVQVSETGTATVPIHLDFAANPGNTALSSEKVITVDYTTTPGTATPDADYTPVSGTLTFKPGITTLNVVVPTLPDGQVEPGETLGVVLSNATNADVGGTPATVVIREAGDTVPGFQVTSGTTVTEGRDGAGQFTVTLSRPSTGDVDFTVTPSEGTARHGATGPGGNDYGAPPVNVRIPQGQTSATVSVPINDDQVFEERETAHVQVALAPNETDAAGAAQQSAITIDDDDPVPTITIDTVRATEGGTADVVVTPTGVAEDPIGYLLNLHGTSTEGSMDPAEPSDFADDQKPAYLPGGSTGPVTIKSIPLAADTIDEATETIKVILQNQTVPNQPLQSTLVEITDDPRDMPPSVILLSTGASEAEGGVDVPVHLAFTPDNGATSTERPVTVGFQVAPETAQTTDFGAPSTPNPMVLPPGTLHSTIRVPITDDGDFEPPESFSVQVTGAGPVETRVLSGNAVVTVNDDDPQPTFAVASDVRVSEDGGLARIDVSLSRPAAGDVEFTAAMRDDTAMENGPGVGGDDYDAPPPTLVIPKGATTGTLTVPIRSDDAFEGDEKAYVTIALAPGEQDAAGVPANVTVTIADTDVQPTIRLNPITVAEGGSAEVTAVVNGSTQRAVPLKDPVADGDGGSGDPAEAGDYELDLVSELPGGTANGSTVRLGTVRIPADTVDETTEGFTLTIGGASIPVRVDDDPADLPPAVSIADETVGEGDDSVTLTATLDHTGTTTATERTITVPWKTVDGTAKGGKDYTARNGTLTFEPGQEELTVSVPVIDDTQLEQDQNFIVRLGAATPADVKLVKADGRVTVDDDDRAKTPTLSLPSSATGSGRVTITGTAGAGSKVELLGAPGTSGGTFKVLATTEADSEGNFTFKPNLTQGYRLQIRADKLTSSIRTVQIKQDPQLVVTSPAKRTARIVLTGDPAREGLNVTVQRQDGRGWDTVGTGKLDEEGMFVVTEKNLTSGKNHVYRATIAASATLGITAGTTPARTIRVK